MFSSLRCSCQDFCQAYLRWRDTDFWLYVTHVTENHDNRIKKNNPRTRNHGIYIKRTAKDQKTWHLSYRKTILRVEIMATMLLEATVRLEPMANVF